MPILAPVWGYREFRLLNEYTFELGGRAYAIPPGFTYDGASVPRFFWRIVTPFDPMVLRAALAHDWFYRRGHVSREDADNHLHELLLEDGVNSFLASAMHRAVRLGGGGAYRGSD